MLGRAGALVRRAGAARLGQLHYAEPHLAAAQLACSVRLADRWADAAAAQCSVTPVRLASGGNGALITTSGRPGLTATARSLLVDTLEMVRNFEKVGLTRQQAEGLTEHLTEVLCQHKEKLSEAYVSKAQLEKTVLEGESRDAGFRSEVLKAQDMHHTTLNRESERLANDVAKVRSEIRYEVEKLTASQRLDLNLEKGRMRDELQALRDKSNELEIKIDKEINALKAAVELTKNETIKYSLGMMFAMLTVGLGVVRLIR